MKESVLKTGQHPGEQKRRVKLVLFLVFLIAPLLSGCGGGWQQDHDTHQDQIRPAVEGTGQTSAADDSGSHV